MGIKISLLPSASVFGGVEALPIVQSGATKRTSINQISVGPHLKNFGAIGNGVTDDTTAVVIANAALNFKFVPPGIYVTSLAATDLDGPYWGSGQIKTGLNRRAPWFSAIKVAPSSLAGAGHDSIDTAFNGDISRSLFTVEHRIIGVATLGQPATGYLYTPEAYPHYTWMFNSSGWNQGTADNVGRTAACAYRTHVQNAGQGDCVAFNATGIVSGTRAGSTSFLANPGVTLYNGDVFGTTDGVYLNPGELSLNDLGFDVAGIGWVINLNRSVATGAKGAFWSGFRAQSVGSADVNSAFSAIGKFDVGLDFSMITTDANRVAAAFKADDRLYFDTSSSNGFYATTLNTTWLQYDPGLTAFNFVVGNASSLQVYNNQVIATGALKSVSPSGGVGYATGAGGVVTQATNKGTGVTLNKIVGQITTANDALGAGAFVGFQLSDSTIGATDLVYAQHISGGTLGSYRIAVDNISAGACAIRIQNVSGGSLSEALVIGFVVVKGVTS